MQTRIGHSRTLRERHQIARSRVSRQYELGLPGWNPSVASETTQFAEAYDYEDEVIDQLARLPSGEVVRLLIAKLRNPELRELAQGIIIDVSNAARERDNLGTMRVINSWMATAAEPLASRRKIRHVLAARERGKTRRAEQLK